MPDFWFPLIRALGKPIPRLRIPFSFAYALAFLFEQLYRLFGVEPMFTRMEMLQVSVSNTYSIEAAKKDFGMNFIEFGKKSIWNDLVGIRFARQLVSVSVAILHCKFAVKRWKYIKTIKHGGRGSCAFLPLLGYGGDFSTFFELI